jgi:hypothetical protein
MSEDELNAIRRLDPWFEKLKLYIQKEPEYAGLLNGFDNKRVCCKFNPGKNNSTVDVEIVWSTGDISKDTLMKTLVKKTILSTHVPPEKRLFKRGADFLFTHS